MANAFWVLSGSLFFYSCFIFIVLKTFIYLFLERGRERERKGENISVQEKHPLVASHTPLSWRPGPQPRCVPWLGIELEMCGFAGWCPTHWATPVRAFFSFFFFKDYVKGYIFMHLPPKDVTSYHYLFKRTIVLVQSKSTSIIHRLIPSIPSANYALNTYILSLAWRKRDKSTYIFISLSLCWSFTSKFSWVVFSEAALLKP